MNDTMRNNFTETIKYFFSFFSRNDFSGTIGHQQNDCRQCRVSFPAHIWFFKQCDIRHQLIAQSYIPQKVAQFRNLFFEVRVWNDKIWARGWLINFLGTLFILPTAGYLCTRKDILHGWPAIFYLSGVISVLVGAFWLPMGADKPSKQYCISRQEQLFIETRSTRPSCSVHTVA